MNARALLEDPLTHFVVVGLVVVAVQWARGEAPSAPDDPHLIVVTPSEIADLRRRLHTSLERVPSDADMGRAMERFIDEEILVREARSRGLEADDAVVRARLADKMRLLLNVREAPAAPAEELLRELYAARRHEYAVAGRATVRQLYFAQRAGTEDAERRARAVLLRLTAGEAPQALADQADPPPGGPVLRRRRAPALADVLGPDADGIMDAPLDTWRLVSDADHARLLRVEWRRDARIPDFEELRARLTTRWLRDQAAGEADDALRELRARYRVEGWP